MIQILDPDRVEQRDKTIPSKKGITNNSLPRCHAGEGIFKQTICRLIDSHRVFLAAGYLLALGMSLALAYQLRFDFTIPAEYRDTFVIALCWIAPAKLLLLMLCGCLSGRPSVFSTPCFFRLVPILAAASLGLLLGAQAGAPFFPPRSIIVADFFLSFIAIGGLRLGIRMAWERIRVPVTQRAKPVRRVGIVGAGDAGGTIARELLTKRHLGLEPVAFYDDNRHTWRTHLHGIPVQGPPELICTHSEQGERNRSRLERLLSMQPSLPRLDEVLIAMPSAPARRIREVAQLLRQHGLPFRILPSVDQLATGAVNVDHLRRVEIHDLLGREPIRIESENIRAVLAGKVVMVTGAGGSIGSELCKQILGFGAAKLLLVEQSEPHLFQIEQELIARGHEAKIYPCIANVLDECRMRLIFENHRPQLVFHAAAHKHVPLMEHHPGEAIKNNTFGTARVAQLSVEFGAERFVLISTDKAINPTNVMGATKRLAEMYMQALHAGSPHGTKLMGVRFGNVLGSSGSVIPTFVKQIAEGGPVKVTHPEITRYFMTIPEAVSLVLQSAAQGEGGEIFVLDMGEPVKIADLAEKMIRLSGLRLGEDIEIKFVGLRPGEKLYEELSTEGEDIAPTHHSKIMRFVAPLPDAGAIQAILGDLSAHLHCLSPESLKLRLKKAVPEYRPQLPAMTFHFEKG